MDEWFERDFSEYSVGLLFDILVALNEKNSQQLDQMDTNCINFGRFLCNSGVVENLITICETLKVEDCVKYLSIELFDKLLVKLVCDTKKVFLETSLLLPTDQSLQWSTIEKKLKKQMHLRAVTTVFIANKLFASNNNKINVTKIQAFLRRTGYKYSLQNINRSELRVLNLLNYNLMIDSVDTYVSVLLAVLNHNFPGIQSDLELYRRVAKHLIDLFYLSRKVIARNGFKIMSKRLSLQANSNEEELEIERIGSNKMLISCAIIASIPLLVRGMDAICKQVVKELSEITAINQDLMVDISHAILIVISDN